MGHGDRGPAGAVTFAHFEMHRHVGNAIGADDIDQLLAALRDYLAAAAPRVA